MVGAVVEVTPGDWRSAIVMDWCDGFWHKMAAEYPRLDVA
jgi:hypothetical protein